MDQTKFARVRAVIESTADPGAGVIVSTKNDGVYTAYAFCTGHYRESFAETAESEAAAIEAAAKRLVACRGRIAGGGKARKGNGRGAK